MDASGCAGVLWMGSGAASSRCKNTCVSPWRVADTFAPVTSVAVLVEASRGATPSVTTPVVLADAGGENVNAQVDDLMTTGVLRRVLAFTELTFSNSMIEAWWRSLKIG